MLTTDDFARMRRQKRQMTLHIQFDSQQQQFIDDRAMYHKDRFEGDISKVNQPWLDAFDSFLL